MNDTSKSIITALAVAVPAGLVGLVLGVVAWFPGFILTIGVGSPTFLQGFLLFIVAGPVCGLLSGPVGALCCGWLGKMIVSRLAGEKYGLLGIAIFGLIGGSIVGVMGAAISGVIVGLFITPMSQ